MDLILLGTADSQHTRLVWVMGRGSLGWGVAGLGRVRGWTKWRRPWGRVAPSMDRGQGLTKYGHCLEQAAEGLTRQNAQLFRGERPTCRNNGEARRPAPEGSKTGPNARGEVLRRADSQAIVHIGGFCTLTAPQGGQSAGRKATHTLNAPGAPPLPHGVGSCGRLSCFGSPAVSTPATQWAQVSPSP